MLVLLRVVVGLKMLESSVKVTEHSSLKFYDFWNKFSEQSTLGANCSTGSVRLADRRDTTLTAEGRVEVCINQAWGTVCSTDFDQEDAGTVCVVAGGFLRSGMSKDCTFRCGLLLYISAASSVIPTRMPGENSPIFLEQLDCTSSDTDLLQCNSYSDANGIHTCTHSQDVSVRCTGIYQA